ncbi:MAG TPA: TRAP transporter small permease [Stellaceae bacterium]|nr:TRAP transporter small permease [Stellaceae bacterium]
MLRPLLNCIDWLGRLDGWIAGVCLAALTLLMISEVTVRALSNVFPWVPASVPNAWEYSSYLMAASFTFGAAMTLRAGGHIRVTLVLARATPELRRVMEVGAALGGTILTGFLAYAMVRFTWSAFARGQTSISSDTPLWIPESLITFGFLLMAAQFLARLIQAIWGLKLEDPALRVASVAE